MKPMVPEVGVGLLGFGTVGAGVVQGLQEHGDLLASRLGVRPRLERIADLDLTRDRGVWVDPSRLTTDAFAVLRDRRVQIVVELIGGTRAARRYVREALRLGKPVVTANKALLAEHGAELTALARRHGTRLYFEGSVGGGIPILRSLREGLVANRIEGILGILNGTCNYILTRMEEQGLPFDEALREAQAQGYAEADPALDIDGVDTAHKATILASLAYGVYLPLAAIPIEGIRNLSDTDIRYARELGYRVKLLAVIRQSSDGRIDVRVHPALVPRTHILASVSDVFNAILVRGDFTGDTLYYGRGAGRCPTASAVLSDIGEAACHLRQHGPLRPRPARSARPPDLRPPGEVVTRWYLRLTVVDRPGVLARLATALARRRISIASVLQKEQGPGGHVAVVMLTHPAPERAMREALREIDALTVVGAPTVRLRIEE